jgi:hypothetical protein
MIRRQASYGFTRTLQPLLALDLALRPPPGLALAMISSHGLDVGHGLRYESRPLPV